MIEQAGIPTVGVSIVRKLTEAVKPPRTVFLRWPFGHPLGEAQHSEQQKTVIMDALWALKKMTVPGTILDLPYKWRRHEYDFANYDPAWMDDALEGANQSGVDADAK